jgi:hypothetical protein
MVAGSEEGLPKGVAHKARIRDNQRLGRQLGHHRDEVVPFTGARWSRPPRPGQAATHLPDQRQPQLGGGGFLVPGGRRLALAPPPRGLLAPPRFRPPERRGKGGFQGLAARQRNPTAIPGKHHIARRLPLRWQHFRHLFPQVRHHHAEQLRLPFGQHFQKSLGAPARGGLPAEHFGDDLSGLRKAFVQRAQLRRRPQQSGRSQHPRLPRRSLSPRQAGKHGWGKQPVDHLLNCLMIDNQRAGLVLVRHPALLGSGWDSADCTTHAVGWHAYYSGKSLSHQDFFPLP